MGNAGAKVNGMEQAPMKFTDTIRKCPSSISWSLNASCSSVPRIVWYYNAHVLVAGMLKVIEKATKDTTSGLMIDW